MRLSEEVFADRPRCRCQGKSEGQGDESMNMLMNQVTSLPSGGTIVFVPPHLIDQFDQAFRRCVELRAFELYEQAGRPEGRDWDHWIQAESEYLFARPKVLESRDRFSLIATIHEKPSRTIQICMAPAE